jgi:serine phosphatase RsbU (regulator of sigma subunit)
MCGHGSEKFDAMVATRQAIRDAAHHGSNPAQTLAKANDLLCCADPLEFATAIFALFNTRQRSLVFANAGHPPPLMAGPFGTFFLEFPEPDLSLGIETGFDPAVHAVSIPGETLLVFYTDGVSERERRPLQGTAQLHDATNVAYRSSSLHAAGVIEEQMSLMGPNPDDAAILTAWTPARWSAGAALRRDDVAGFHQHAT